MAQRSFLIPVSAGIQELFLELIATESSGPVWRKIYDLARRHQQLLFYSKSFAEYLNQEKAAEKPTELALGMFLNMRPYLITEKETTKAVEVIDNLLECATDEDIVNIFTGQCNRVYDFLNVSEMIVPQYTENISIFDGVKKQIEILKGFKEAYRQKKSISLEVPKQTETELRIEVNLSGETEMRLIQYPEIPWHYGELIGQTFGELCGLCYPSWWLGRNYWFGLLLKGELGTVGRIPYLGVRRFIRTHSKNPTILFEKLKIPGFEKGFDINAPFNQLGYYFPAGSVSVVADGLAAKYREKLHKLGKAVTNYGDSDIQCCEVMLLESFQWAANNKLGLVEGDDLVDWMEEQ